MGPYAYPIEIKRDPQPIREEKVFEITQKLTIAYLESLGIGRDEEFYYNSVEWDDEKEPTISVFRIRPETPEELATRVAKEELYMAHYTEYNAAPDSETRIALRRKWGLLVAQ